MLRKLSFFEASNVFVGKVMFGPSTGWRSVGRRVQREISWLSVMFCVKFPAANAVLSITQSLCAAPGCKKHRGVRRAPSEVKHRGVKGIPCSGRRSRGSFPRFRVPRAVVCRIPSCVLPTRPCACRNIVGTLAWTWFARLVCPSLLVPDVFFLMSKFCVFGFSQFLKKRDFVH